MTYLQWSEFENVDIRVGTIVQVEDFPQSRKPAYKLQIDFGKEIGIKKSSAQITDLYNKNNLIGKKIIAVVNFAPKQIGHFLSECLITGFYQDNGNVVLAVPDGDIPNGSRLG